ncbi:Hypothetical predicted protein, partial [Paramuricea clavata]
IYAIYEEVFNAWNEDESLECTHPDDVNCEKMYYMAMEKRRYHRKTRAVQQYEDVDEYVDNMYLTS